MTRPRRTHTKRTPSKGFTLVELVIVIGIIAVLTALTVATLNVVAGKSAERRTRTTLDLLDLAVQEHVDTIGRPLVFHWDPSASAPPNANLSVNDPHLYSVSRLMESIGRSETVRSTIARIEPKFVFEYDEAENEQMPAWIRAGDPADPNDPDADDARQEYEAGQWDGTLAILDAWETPIRVVHAGPLATNVPTPAVDEDGTVRLDREIMNREPGVDSGFYSDSSLAVESTYGIARNRRLLFVSAGPDRRFGDLAANPESEQFSYTRDNVYSYEPILPPQDMNR